MDCFDPLALWLEIDIAAQRYIVPASDCGEPTAVGGVPRERAKTEAGRVVVERWLQQCERRGFPTMEGEPVWLDLDPLRVELGMARTSDPAR